MQKTCGESNHGFIQHIVDVLSKMDGIHNLLRYITRWEQSQSRFQVVWVDAAIFDVFCNGYTYTDCGGFVR